MKRAIGKAFCLLAISTILAVLVTSAGNPFWYAERLYSIDPMGQESSQYRLTEVVLRTSWNQSIADGANAQVNMASMSENDTLEDINLSQVTNKNRNAPILSQIGLHVQTCRLNGLPVTRKGLECRRRIPHVIGIGIEKCGTGALSMFVKLHPNVVHSDPKELYYWTKNQNKSLDWYRNLMPVSSKYQLTMEYTPSYIFGRDVPYVIKEKVPGMKFVVMIRDPVIRAVSHYVHIKYYSWPSLFKPRPRDPSGKARAFLNDTFETTVLTPNGDIFEDNAVVDNGLYEVHLRRWFGVFPREQFLIIDEDVFRNDPVTVLQQLEEFLEIPRYFDDEHFYFDEERGLFCQKIPYKLCPSKLKGRPHPTLRPDVFKKLTNYYHPFNLRLEKLLNRTFSWT